MSSQTGTYNDTVDNGNGTSTDTHYSCTKTAMQYTTIGEDIKGDFAFIKSTDAMGNGLNNDFLPALKKALDVEGAFYFSAEGDTVEDIQIAYDDINNKVTAMLASLDKLHAAFMTAIDNVNAELEFNFGHWIGFSASRKSATRSNGNG